MTYHRSHREEKKTRSVNSCVRKNERNRPLTNIIRFIQSDDRHHNASNKRKKNAEDISSRWQIEWTMGRCNWDWHFWDVVDIETTTKDCIHYPMATSKYVSFVSSNDHFRKFFLGSMTKSIKWFRYFQQVWSSKSLHLTWNTEPFSELVHF